MAGRTYNKSSRVQRRTSQEPIRSTAATGRSVSRCPKSKPTKDFKPLAAPKQAEAVKSQSTAEPQAILTATKASHPVPPTIRRSVTFSLDATTGSYVAVGGTFSNWRPRVMTKGQDGGWHITLQLARGMHQYRFQVDARWREDPKNLRNAPNAHGSFNSIREVL